MNILLSYKKRETGDSLEQYFTNNPNLKSELRTIIYKNEGETLTFFSDNGVFSKDKLDFGSTLLLETVFKNINKENKDGSVIATLHQSLEILQDCYKNDLRRGFHARIFGELVLKLYDTYGYDEVEKYVETADEWLANEIISKNNGNTSIKKMKQIKKELESKVILPNR